MTKDKSQDRDRPGADPGGPASPQGSLGAWLRGQREARGVSLRDIADASKISLRYLEALELDRFEVLPAPIFTRGFLREYARVVGLDPDEVVNLFLLAVGAPAAEAAPPPVVARSRSGRAASGPSSLGYGLLLGVAVVILLAIAALLSLWASRRSRPAPEPGADAGAPVAAAPAPASPPERIRPAEPVAEPRAELPSEPVVSRPLPPAGPAEPAPGIAPPPAPGRVETPPAGAPAPPEDRAAVPAPAPGAAEPPAAEPLRLSLEFDQDSWVELVVDGQRRSGELRTAGEVVAIEAREFVLLTLGNSPGVRVEVDGRPYPLPESSLRVVRDLRIDRAAVAGPPATLRP